MHEDSDEPVRAHDGVQPELAESRLSDRADPVPDEVWNEAARHYNEAELSALVASIGVINMFNRINVATRQVGGEWIAELPFVKSI